MFCSFRRFRPLTVIAAVSLTFAVSFNLTPAQAGNAGAAQKQAAGRGWQVFLPPSIVHMPTGIAIDLRGAKHAAQWGYVADAGTGRIVKFGTRDRVLRSW